MKNIKKIFLKLTCKMILSPKSFSEPLPNTRHITCGKQDITVLTNTSNNIIRIKQGEDYLYFRECKLHKEIHQYVADEIDLYYSKIRPEYSNDKQFIEMALTNKRNFRKFTNMGMVNDTSSGAYHFCMGHGAHYIGLSGITSTQEERIKDFVQFIWGDLFTYTLNKGIHIGQYQIYNAIRNIAFYRLASLLDIQHLIPKTEYATLCIDNETCLFGTIMEAAPGICMEKMSCEARKEASSPALQRALNNLNILDVICLEKDHRPGNYNVVFYGNRASYVVAFDNDSPNSFGIGDISFETYIGCSPWAIHGQINRPYVDRTLADNILNIKEKELCGQMKDILNTFQLFTLKNRIKKIKKVLATTPDNKLIDEYQWSEDTINEELTGKYGNTYLVKFLHEQKLASQPWIKDQ